MKFISPIFLILSFGAQAQVRHPIPVSLEGSELPDAISYTHLEAIGRMTVQIRDRQTPSTVVHIGDGLVLSAGHVISQHQCSKAIIAWGARSDRVTSRSRCLDVIYQETGRYKDLLLMKVSDAPKYELKNFLFPHEEYLSDLESSQLILLGHPAGRDLHFSRGKMIRIERKTLLVSNLPTMSGHSGAPVFHGVTGHLLGIHSGRADGYSHATWLRGINLPLIDF